MRAPILGTQWGEHARSILEQYNAADPENLEEAINSLLNKNEAPTKPAEAIKLPSEAQAIPAKGRFLNYLQERGFDKPSVLAAAYDLRCCTTGRYKDRIIIPVYDAAGKLAAWTSRAIGNSISAPRYLSDSNAIKTIIYNLPNLLLGGEVLFITEGPFDCLKVDYYAARYDCGATAVFGTSITPDQISLLSDLSKRFKKTVILLDPDAIESAFNLSDWLPKAEFGWLPARVEDPGALNKSQVKDLVQQFS